MTAEKLEPCPCCGSSTHPHFASRYDGERLLWKATCANPDMLCSVQTGYYFDKESCAIIWNRRAALEAKPAATQGEVEAVAKAIRKRAEFTAVAADSKDGSEALARAAIAAMPKALPVQAEHQRNLSEVSFAISSAISLVACGWKIDAAVTATLERLRPYLRSSERESVGRQLVTGNDNVDAWRLGECAEKAGTSKDVGDYIDTGLLLLRLLKEKGYAVTRIEADPTS